MTTNILNISQGEPLNSTRLITVNDFDSFVSNDLNRDFVKSTLDMYAANLEKGVFLPYPPVLVNYETKVILDGHHRIKAVHDYYVKNLKLPELYVMFVNAADKDIAKLNQTGKVWKTKDYLKYYCKMNNPQYIYLNNALTEINNLQKKELFIASRIPDTSLIKIMQGFSPSVNHRKTDNPGLRGGDSFNDGRYIVFINKELIINSLKIYKNLENFSLYGELLKTHSAFRDHLIIFLIVCNAHGLDMNDITNRLINHIPLRKPLKDSLKEHQDPKEVLFNALYQNMKQDWQSFAAMFVSYRLKLLDDMFKPEELK